ncbi:hypothetical protein [Pyrococcus kukulkanii]|uniref:hypothetical protein n=1 Tax=Pyrococcus kukulkanii TaxID=1609559 RepID=UPI001D1262DD|nr:hypothetical protein [Pyrococcus kukulkanii]
MQARKHIVVPGELLVFPRESHTEWLVATQIWVIVLEGGHGIPEAGLFCGEKSAQI